MSFVYTRSSDPLKRIPSWAVERLKSCPVAGNGVNDWLFSTAGLLWKYLCDPNEIADLLIRFSANCGRVVPESELNRAIWRSSQLERLPSKNSTGTPFASATHAVSIKKIEFDPAKLAVLAAQGPKLTNWRHWLWQRSPLRPDIHTGVWFLRRIFREGENALVFSSMRSSEPTLKVAIAEAPPPNLPVEAFDNHSREGAWYLANPVDGEWHPNSRESGKLSCRSEESVTSFRYAVLESDSAKPDHWLSFLSQLPAPITAIYTSGGRSIHALLRVNAATKIEWDDKINLLKRQLRRLGADSGALTAVRLSRLPGCWRREKGGFQKLLYLNQDPPEDTPIQDLPIRETRAAALKRWRQTCPRWQSNQEAFQ